MEPNDNKRRILFTGMGTSDPVRSYHDGPMMHIARHYRPEKICIFLTKEMQGYYSDYYKPGLDFMRDKWGYTPEICLVNSNNKDSYDLDKVADEIKDEFKKFVDASPEADEILVNLTSGTPQMQIVFAQLALSAHNMKGVQVTNPEGAAGRAPRINSDDYDLEDQLEHNKDELSETESRCMEPEFLAIQKEHAWKAVQRLLERGDYAAVRTLSEAQLSPNSQKIVKHLSFRDLLQDAEARNTVAGLPDEIQQAIPFYPENSVEGYAPPNYWDVVNYWLMMKNCLRAERYSEFLLRLSVLTLYLQEAQLQKLFAEQGISYDDVTYPSKKYGDDRVLSMEALQKCLSDVYKSLCEHMPKDDNGDHIEPEDGRSVFLFMNLLNCMPGEKDMSFFNKCENMTKPRNDVAHRLKAVTQEEFGEQICLKGMAKKKFEQKKAKFLKLAEETIQAIYPQCDPAVFDLHDKCVEYIKHNR